MQKSSGLNNRQEVKLRLLDLSYNALTSKGLEYFISDCLPELPYMQELILNGNWLENKTLGVFARTLRDLNVERL